MKNTDNKDPNYVVTIIAEKDGSTTIVPISIKVEEGDLIKFLFISENASKKDCTLDFSSKEWDNIIKGPRKPELNSDKNRSTLITLHATSDDKPIEYFVIISDSKPITPTPTMIIRGGPAKLI